MADFFDHITEKHAEFIAEQPMFFTATACASGRINLSPKGNDSFRVISPNLCGYIDMGGSGNETAAHIKNDGRITVMFNSFTRNPLIYRLYGKGRVVRPGHNEFADLRKQFPAELPARQIVLIDVESTQTSCGYAVPLANDMVSRDTLVKWVEKKGETVIREYEQKNNLKSIDGFDTGLND
ncbi:pyridoxamine 5'-phosphate oxidase family protein [Kordiimonas aquimaris]|uniref:pyridoxamine 5'-phosphate oxidase family protein n=1 Tax=Kordiimonas aquimaris TaxID=707591 RepID=UPI0021D0255F|nr:pyridoxamine 5'-phosphate oxidase family protein [Kordiimonas aquimaris]